MSKVMGVKATKKLPEALTKSTALHYQKLRQLTDLLSY